MADAEVLFILQEGSTGPTARPGSAAATPRAPGGSPAGGAGGGAGGGAVPGSAADGAATIAQAIRDGLRRFAEYQLAPGFFKAGAEFLRPLLGLERLVADLRGGGALPGSAAGAPAAAGGQGGEAIDRAIFEGPQQAVFNSQNAEFVFRGGTYRFDGPGRGQIPQLEGPDGGGAGGGLILRPSPTTRIPGTGSAGPGAAAAASAEGSGAAASGGLAAVGTSAALAAVGIGLLVVAVGSAVVAMRALYNRANRQADELQGFSPELAQAQAQARVRALEQQLRTADSLGPQLARLVEVQSRGSVALDRLLNVIEERFLAWLIPKLDAAVTLLEGIANGAEYLSAIHGVLSDVAAGKVALLDAAGEIQKRIQAVDDRNENRRGDLLSLFMDIPDLSLEDPAGKPGRPGGISVEISAPGFGTFYEPAD